MAALIPTNVEADVRAFAAAYPTPNVLRAVELCEAGRISWADVYQLACVALDKARETVR